MTEKERVEAWLAEAGEEPTPFGKAVIEIGRERGFPTVAEDVCVLELEERHERSLIDHMDGVDSRNEDDQDFVQSVAFVLGLDPEDPKDAPACMKLALTHMFGGGFKD